MLQKSTWTARSGSVLLRAVVPALAVAGLMLPGPTRAQVREVAPGVWASGRPAQPGYARRNRFGPGYPAGRRIARSGANRRPTVNVKGDGKKAAIDLSSEVQALKSRHTALVAKLPAELRHLDPAVMSTVERLPMLAQFSYLTTVEDYPTLPSADQTQLKAAMQGIDSLSDRDRDRFVESAGKTFGDIESSASQVKTARSAPHATFFKVNTELSRLQQAPVPSSPAAVSSAPGGGKAATPVGPTPGAK